MKYILDKRYRLRGWSKAPFALFDTLRKEPLFLTREELLALMRCDGAHDVDLSSLSEKTEKLLRDMEKEGVIRPARLGEFLLPEQEYYQYPARYKKNAHWSVTGACNLRCRHCFMSAPHAKHGSPAHEQLMSVVEQLAECGVFQVGITGGEPLIRDDLIEILEELTKREIGVDAVYTNGWLVDGKLLDSLDRISPARKIPFQLSFDGTGCHDFLRGVPGAEKKTLDALRLLGRRGYPVSVSMCLHRGNIGSVRESVRLMASLGVRSMKIGSMMYLGEWTDPELRGLELTPEETMAFYESYIPQYFEDDAPLSLMLSGAFGYTPGDGEYGSFFVRPTPPEHRDSIPSCGSIVKNFYIGADGMVAPCMGMCDCGFASRFPNLYETPLREILGESEFMRLCNAAVSDVHNGNRECAGCEYKDRCSGGCRNSALTESENYYGADHEACFFFRHNGEERIRAAASGAFAAYLERHPAARRAETAPRESKPECP